VANEKANYRFLKKKQHALEKRAVLNTTKQELIRTGKGLKRIVCL
jgi:hypothetical protein